MIDGFSDESLGLVITMDGFVSFNFTASCSGLALDDDPGPILGGLAGLPSRTRSVLLLRRFEGLSSAEIARRMQMSEEAVEADLAAGLKALLA